MPVTCVGFFMPTIPRRPKRRTGAGRVLTRKTGKRSFNEVTPMKSTQTRLIPAVTTHRIKAARISATESRKRAETMAPRQGKAARLVAAPR